MMNRYGRLLLGVDLRALTCMAAFLLVRIIGWFYLLPVEY